MLKTETTSFIKELSDQDFNKLSSFIYTNYGIKMPIAKKGMLQSRLQQRLRETQIDNFKEYCEYALSGGGDETEIVHMIDVVSTNKTDFFRESLHFDYMTSTILPELAKVNNREPIKIWSSACSSGEEAYTIAITMEEFHSSAQKLDYSIFGTDISTRILSKAKHAIYSEERIANIPLNIKKKYFLRSKERETPTVKLIDHLKNKTRFQRLNLMDPSYKIQETFDIIFCRNVLIYFDRPTQESVINKLCKHLKPNGYFLLGHSESITGINVPLRQLKPTIYIKK